MKSFTMILATLLFLAASELPGCADVLPPWACGADAAVVQGSDSATTDTSPDAIPTCVGVTGESNREDWAHQICGVRETSSPPTCHVCPQEVDANGQVLVWAAIQFQGACNCGSPYIRR